MYSARSARHLLAVATIIVAIALCYAAAVGGGTGPSPDNTAVFAPSSILTKLPLSQLPKFPVIYTYGKLRTPRPPATNPPTLLGGKQQQLQRPVPQSQRPSQHKHQQQPQQTPQQTIQPQKRPSKPTTDERPGGRVPNEPSTANASMTTTLKPKLETTTHDRSIISAPIKTCPQGQRMSPDRICRPDFTDPEDS